MKAALALAAALTLAAGPALAGHAVALKAEVVDADGVVTLGDLFDDAGAAGSTPVAVRAGDSVILDARAVQVAARRAGLDWVNAQGLRKIIVGGAAPSTRGPTASATRGNVDVLTYARNLAAGEMVQPADLVWSKAAAAPADAPGDADAVIGLVARRPLRAGSPVSARDVAAAQVVKAGDLITVNYEAAGISLSLQGRAMGAAAVGESLTVQNTTSKKVLQAVATGPGQAVVGAAADRFQSTRYAFR